MYYERSRKFQDAFKTLCNEKKVKFIDVGVGEEEWKEKYVYDDGLHANSDGHRMIADKILAELDTLLE